MRVEGDFFVVASGNLLAKSGRGAKEEKQINTQKAQINISDQIGDENDFISRLLVPLSHGFSCFSRSFVLVDSIHTFDCFWQMSQHYDLFLS